MSLRPDFGELSLSRPLTPDMLEAFSAGPVRTLEDYQQAMAFARGHPAVIDRLGKVPVDIRPRFVTAESLERESP